MVPLRPNNSAQTVIYILNPIHVAPSNAAAIRNKASGAYLHRLASRKCNTSNAGFSSTRQPDPKHHESGVCRV